MIISVFLLQQFKSTCGPTISSPLILQRLALVTKEKNNFVDVIVIVCVHNKMMHLGSSLLPLAQILMLLQRVACIAEAQCEEVFVCFC